MVSLMNLQQNKCAEAKNGAHVAEVGDSAEEKWLELQIKLRVTVCLNMT
jgi:hypothetical protein